jgi:NAD(P)-dependent dehydrogenase (short-subunit alcohol dehydrogenase family)
MPLLQGKVVVVTGGSEGIGFGIVQKLAAEGAQVVFCSRSADKGAKALQELQALGLTADYLQADVGVRAQAESVVSGAIERYGRIDGLINNAQAEWKWVTVENKTEEAYDKALSSGFHASRWLMNAVFPHFKAQGGGRIINFGSRRAVYGAKLSAEYNSTKEAIRGLTRSAAREWGQYNITVNVICPACESAATIVYMRDNPEMAARTLLAIPMRRLGKPVDDLGALVAGLLGDDARFITGQTFFADGGLHLKRPE